MKTFKGKFNHSGELHELWTKAQDEDRAFTNFVHQLGETLGIKGHKLYANFKMDKRPKYEIREVKPDD